MTTRTLSRTTNTSARVGSFSSEGYADSICFGTTSATESAMDALDDAQWEAAFAAHPGKLEMLRARAAAARARGEIKPLRLAEL